MTRSITDSKVKWTRIILMLVIASMVVAACTSSDDSAETNSAPAVEPGYVGEDGYEQTDMMLEDELAMASETTIAASQAANVYPDTISIRSADAMIIRNGSIELRIEYGTFATSANQVRTIAADLGGYVSSGETHIEHYSNDRYAVGWYTLKIPTDRFDEAVSRIEKLGDPVSASLSSQDVTEEYVDLEGRLNYWREQEAFYTRLMDEAESIEDLVIIQTRMQDVLLNIEQIEGRLRYLDSRTDFATLTVGLTEVPSDYAPADEPDQGIIAEAFEQAGEVLLATVGFLIVAAAVAIPIGILVFFAYGVFRLFTRTGRKESAQESTKPSTDES